MSAAFAQLEQGVSVMMKRVWQGSVVVVAVAVGLMLSGCPKKKAAVDTTTTQFGEKGMGGTSLDAFKRGEAGAEGSPLADVHFDYDRYDLSSEARSTLQSNAEWLKTNASAKVEVEGHCDDRGTVEYNLALGAKRAKAVKDYLVTLGIGGDRLSTISYGEELPLCREESESCWSRNRRAHAVVLQ